EQSSVRVAINLASRQFADIAPVLKNLRIAMGALALAAIALSFGLHAIHDRAEAARQLAHSLDGTIDQATRERQQDQARMQKPDNAPTLQQAESLNQPLDEKAFSWTIATED